MKLKETKIAAILAVEFVLVVVSRSAYAADLIVPHTFSPGMTAKSSEVNENFGTIYSEVNALKKQISSLSNYKLQPSDYKANTMVNTLDGASGLGVIRVTIATHQFGYATGYWEYNVFFGQHNDSKNISLINSHTYNNPTIPEVLWSDKGMLQWRWNVSTTGGPGIVVTAEILSGWGVNFQ